MRVLTLTQPWASLIADGRKTIETRGWPVSFRGPLAIHAAIGWRKDDREFAFECGYKPEEMVRGAVVCVAWLHDVIPTEKFSPTAAEYPFGDYSAGRYAWVLDPAKMIVLPKPFEAKGAQGIWHIEDRSIAPWIPEATHA